MRSNLIFFLLCIMTKKRITCRERKSPNRKTLKIRSKKNGSKKVTRGGAVEDILGDNKYEKFNGEFKRIFKSSRTMMNEDMIKELYSFVHEPRTRAVVRKEMIHKFPKLKEAVDTIFESLDGQRMTVELIKNNKSGHSCELTDNIEECLRLFVFENACEIIADLGYTDATIRKKLSDSSVGSSLFETSCHVIIPIIDKSNKKVSIEDIDEVPIIKEDDEKYDFEDYDGRQEMKERNICLQFRFNPLEYDSIVKYHQKKTVFAKCT